MTTISTKIPDSLFRQAQSIAEREEISFDELVAIALAGQISAFETKNSFTQRAARGDWEKAREILANVPDTEPDEQDKF